MIMWLLWSCTSPSPPVAETGTPPVVDTAQDTAVDPPDTREPVAMVFPPEAEDLDPEDGSVRVSLTAAPHIHTFEDVDGTIHTVEGYAYNGSTPGPTIRLQKGDVLTVDFTNALNEPTTIHWHGLDVPFEMDGVTWKGAPVQPGETFVYQFTVEQTGTFWYHPHFNSNEQVSAGLYGAVIVEEPSDPVVAHDDVLIVADWYLSGEVSEHDHSTTEGTWTVNGQIQPTLSVDAGETMRARVINVSSLGYVNLSTPQMRLIGTDQGIGGGLLQPETVLLSPGDRAELEWLFGGGDWAVEDRPYVHQGGDAYGASQTLMNVVVNGDATKPEGLPWPFSGEAPTADPGRTDVTYVFSGSRESGVWLMNGAVFPNITPDEVQFGDEVIIEVRNLSPAEHPYHLHGIRFEVLSVDGVPPPHKRIEDTINVGVYGTVRLRLVADNPGDWMSHCHILPHAEGGMMTVLRVLEEQGE